jgi:agmatinase
VTSTEPRFQVFPGLQIEANGEAWRICNPVMGYDMPAPAGLIELIERARQPQTAAALGTNPETLATLLQRYLLIAEDEAEIVGRGVQLQVERPLGEPLALAQLERCEGVVFVGAPIDAGGGLAARRGPDLIRRAYPMPWRTDAAPKVLDFEYRREVDVGSLELRDVGDVPWFPNDGLDRYGSRLKHVTKRLLSAGARPVVLGGDHSITSFVLDAMFERYPGLHIVHFDAHTDTFTGTAEPLCLNHANVMLFALRDPRLGGLLQLGLRMPEPSWGDRGRDDRVRFLSARELYRADPDSVFQQLPAGVPCYVTFDADVLSPLEAPNTGTPEIGGLSFYTAMDLFDALSRRVKIIGADFVEVAATPGGLTGTNTTALITAKLLMQLVLGLCPWKPLEGYVPNHR